MMTATPHLLQEEKLLNLPSQQSNFQLVASDEGDYEDDDYDDEDYGTDEGYEESYDEDYNYEDEEDDEE